MISRLSSALPSGSHHTVAWHMGSHTLISLQNYTNPGFQATENVNMPLSGQMQIHTSGMLPRSNCQWMKDESYSK